MSLEGYLQLQLQLVQPELLVLSQINNSYSRNYSNMLNNPWNQHGTWKQLLESTLVFLHMPEPLSPSTQILTGIIQ